MKKIHSILLLAAFAETLTGCGTAKIAGRNEIGAAPTMKPAIIYVADFELEADTIKSERGLLPMPGKLPGPLGDMLPHPPGAPKDPQTLAHDLVESMTTSIVKGLAKNGVMSRRLTPDSPIPTNGWLVRGVFTEVNQGNQLRRAMIGFGSGKTDLQVLVDFNDLSQGPPRPFYKVSTTADSGKAPGAAPTIILGPAGAAARFVIAGQDLNRNVKQTAAKIAAEAAQRTTGLAVAASKND